jgi:hypothetical protein
MENLSTDKKGEPKAKLGLSSCISASGTRKFPSATVTPPAHSLSSTLPQISPPTPHTSHPFVHLIESIAVPEIPVLKIRHILESVRVDIIPLKSVIPHGVPPLADVADDEDVDDEADVDAEVDVEAV